MKRFLLFLIPLIGFVACSDSPTTAPNPDLLSLSIVGGNDQVGQVGQELNEPLTVYIEATQGKRTRPLAGVVVNFIVTEGGGSVWAGTGVTDENGFASDYWTLGPTIGENTVEVRAVDGDGTKHTYDIFHATAAVGNLPELVTNTGITVARNGRRVISHTALEATDVESPRSELTYTVVSGPSHGSLAHHFTQDDILRGGVYYYNDGNEATTDEFSVTVTDGDGNTVGPFVVEITVTPGTDPPYIVNNTGLTVTEGGYVVITPDQLLAADDVSDDADIIYHIADASYGPWRGSLQPYSESFTQADINAGIMIYLSSRLLGTGGWDSFAFWLEDGSGNFTRSMFNVDIIITPPGDGTP